MSETGSASKTHVDAAVSGIVGIHHFGLTVRSVETSAAWYESVLGFIRVGEYDAPDGSRRKVFLRHQSLHVRLGLTQHRDGGACQSR